MPTLNLKNITIKKLTDKNMNEYFDYKRKPEKGWEKCNMEERKKQWDLFFKE